MAEKKKIERIECHLSQAITIEAKIREDDEAIYSPTVPLVEGIAVGNDGLRRVRLFEEFGPYTNRLNGLLVVANHEELTPDARILGQLTNPIARADKKDAFAITKFFKRDITPAESEKIKSGKPFDGSIAFMCYAEFEPGTWNGESYDVKEVGPYIFEEYSLVKSGVVSPEMGAGFNVQSKLRSSAHRAATRGIKMEGEIDTSGHEPELKESVDALKVEFESIKREFAIVKEENTKLKATIEADQKARVLEAFTAKLKPGHQEKASELFAAYQKDPAAWVLENADKFVQARETKGLQGKAITEGGASGWNLEQERAKLKAEGKVI